MLSRWSFSDGEGEAGFGVFATELVGLGELEVDLGGEGEERAFAAEEAEQDIRFSAGCCSMGFDRPDREVVGPQSTAVDR